MNRDQAILNTVADQRNNALNDAALARADCAVLAAQIEDLKKQIEALTPKPEAAAE